MNSASFTAARGARTDATTLDEATAHPRHAVSNTLRAIKVFAGAAVSVVLLGAYSDKQSVRAV
ncbi:hypothetical protein ABZ769_09460 [Streptomyces olivoreticuli]